MSALSVQVSRRKLQRLARGIRNARPSTVDATVLWAWMAMLAFGVLAFGAVEAWSLATFEIGAGALLIWWVVSGMHRGSLSVHMPAILAPASVFFAYIALQVVARVTVYPFATKNSLLLFATYGIAAFIGAQVLDSEERFQRFGLALCIFGLCVSTLAIAQALTSPGRIYWTIYPTFGDGVFGPYVNHSHYAGLMEMLIPFPFILGRGRTLRRDWRGLAFTTGAIMVASVFMASSRGGIVALLVELCLLYFVILRPSEEEAPKRRAWVSTITLLAVAGLSILLGGQEMIARMSSLRDPYGSSVGATRIAIAKDCLKMFAHRPFLGWGAGVFQETFPAFRSFPTNLIVNAAHNDYLQLLVEFGIVGVLISAWFLFIAYRRFGVLVRNWKDSWPHSISLAALLGTVGILVHSLTDFNLQIPANAAIFYVMCTVASLRPRGDDLASQGSRGQ